LAVDAVNNSSSLKYQIERHFKDDELLAVDAVNNGKAYVLGGRFIKGKQKIDKEKLMDSSVKITPVSFLAD
jgi:3-phenylpropionate/trans-cinnamate dioxygenase ferredoxin reductase subunit